MFHSLFVNYKVLSADHRCIYSEYKICLEKYWKVKRLLKDTRIENNQMKQELKRLRNEMAEEVLVKECIIYIQDVESDCDESISDVDKYELV